MPLLIQCLRCLPRPACRRWWMALAGAVTWLLLAPAWAQPVPVTLAQALFQRLDGPPAAEAWQPVALPDTWGARGLPLAGRAHYRLQARLDQAPQGVWALRIDRFSNAHSIHVNGVLVHQRGDTHSSPVLPRPLPVLVEIPAPLLRAGDNQIDLQWRLGGRAGMSAPVLGPSALVLAGHHRARLLDHSLPQVMNVACAALAGFMLLVWWQRRREQAIGLFGALWLLMSLRNYSYTVDASPLPGALGDALFFTLQAESAVLLCGFALALSAHSRPRLRRLLWGLAALLPLAGLLGAAGGQLAALRQWLYPLLMLLNFWSLWLLWHSLRRAPGLAQVVLLAGLVAAVAAGVHDYLFLQALLPVTGMYWLPVVIPLGCASFALLLIQRLVGALAVSEDLTQRLEARVAERTLALQAANQAQSRFLAAASHDLRQPVAAIGLLVGLAREQAVAADAVLRSMLDRSHAAVLALEDMLRGLLDLSRLDAAEATVQRQPVALQPLFDALALHHQGDAQARGLRLRLRPTALVVQTDPVLLDQVLRNLVGNALRHTRRGAVLVAARRHRVDGVPGVRLQVWDTGIGIAPEQQQRVFEPFVQLHNPARDRSQGQGLGQGLGLAIVRRAVDLLGHPLALRSVPGRGSCFSIDLPQVAAPTLPPQPPALPATPLAGRRLWLLDDDPVVHDALASRLLAWGAQVLPLASLAALQQALDSGAPTPDLLLTDHRLPDGDGLQAITRLRALRGPVLVLVVTGDTAALQQAAYARQGAGLLHKPFQPDQLLQRLLTAAG